MVSFHTQNTYIERLKPYLRDLDLVQVKDGLPVAAFLHDTPGLRANAYYFGQPKWPEGWLKFVHRNPLLKERWQAVGGSWDGKVVIDIGCGPGNLQATLSADPAILIGIDVSPGTLHVATKLGYIPLLADAHKIPLRSAFADVVAMNAAIHHCDDMEKVIVEAARLVRPGGIFIADHDPQLSAYNLRGPGKMLWNLRRVVYRFLQRGGHRAEDAEQQWAAATEIHHKPGDGVTEELFRSLLEPMGFAVTVYPHNHLVGKAVLQGIMGRAPLKMRIAQLLSGIRPNTKQAALSLLCVAKKKCDL